MKPIGSRVGDKGASGPAFDELQPGITVAQEAFAGGHHARHIDILANDGDTVTYDTVVSSSGKAILRGRFSRRTWQHTYQAHCRVLRPGDQ
jgi:hypothetical protein